MTTWLSRHDKTVLNRALIIPGLTGVVAGVIVGSALIAWASQTGQPPLAGAIARDTRAQLAYGLEWPPRHPAFLMGEP